jgi:hypothetical protein
MHNRILYMILILPRHCLIYMILILSYIRQWRGRFRIIYKSDGEESGSYIRQWRGKIRIIYKIRLCIIWITIIRCKQRTSCLSCLKGFFFHCFIYDPDSSRQYLYSMLFTYSLFRLTRKSEVCVFVKFVYDGINGIFILCCSHTVYSVLQDYQGHFHLNKR